MPAEDRRVRYTSPPRRSLHDGRVLAIDLCQRQPTAIGSQRRLPMLRRVWILSSALLALGMPSLWGAESSSKIVEIASAPQRWGTDGPGGVPGFTHHVQPL